MDVCNFSPFFQHNCIIIGFYDFCLFEGHIWWWCASSPSRSFWRNVSHSNPMSSGAHGSWASNLGLLLPKHVQWAIPWPWLIWFLWTLWLQEGHRKISSHLDSLEMLQCRFCGNNHLQQLSFQLTGFVPSAHTCRQGCIPFLAQCVIVLVIVTHLRALKKAPHSMIS